MTSKEIFEYALVELNKKEAPSLLLEDYNYFINKAVNQYINKMYNAYNINQQKTDDLRVLKASSILTPEITTNSAIYINSNLNTNIAGFNLPDDYLHILNCIVEYKLLKNYKCYNKDSFWQQGAKRLTSDMHSQIINNFYLKPSYKNPYYFINNTNYIQYNDYFFNVKFSTNNLQVGDYIIFTIKSKETSDYKMIYDPGNGDDYHFSSYSSLTHKLDGLLGIYFPYDSEGLEVKFPDIVSINSNTESVEITYPDFTKKPYSRYGNSSKVRMEIRYGKDDNTFKLEKIYVDYLKSPQFIRLTQDQIEEVEDNSQVIEFPDYVCQEIINELVSLLMENASDPRIQSHIPINTSIPNPAQQQQGR